MTMVSSKLIFVILTVAIIVENTGVTGKYTHTGIACIIVKIIMFNMHVPIILQRRVNNINQIYLFTYYIAGKNRT